MPRLEHGNHSLYNGRIVDKENEEAVFFDDTHEYFEKNTGRKGISVTTLIGLYEQPFQAEFWSSYKALEQIMDLQTWIQVKKALLTTKKFDKRFITKFDIDEEEFNKKKQEILDSYEKKKQESCDRGTKIHAKLEQELYNKDPSIKRYGFGGLLDVYEGNYSRELKDGIYPEYMISYSDSEIFLIGQIDLLTISNKRIIIVDHKTNSKIEFKSFYDQNTKSSVKMKYPLNDLDDVNFNHYQLQLSIYAWMVQKIHPDYEVERLTIHWIDHDDNESFIECKYLKDDVEKVIAHYKKMKKIQEELDKDKPFII